MSEHPIELPVTRVVLYSSGVGYFEHEGSVEGDAAMRLLFSAEQINDVLNSLVLADLDGGSVRSITYPTQEPIQKSLASFEIDVSQGLSVAGLLTQVRGSQVRVYGSLTLEGTVLDVESQPRVYATPDVAVTEHALVLSTSEGIHRIPLSSVERFELADPRLQQELDQALALQADARNTQRRPLDIRFTGSGKRRVRLGYLLEAAVWKTSYRLDLSVETPRLVGWAMIDNTSGSDWSDVRLSLISGRPISFIQDLYTPQYVARPTVAPDPQGGILPPPALAVPPASQAMRRMWAEEPRSEPTGLIMESVNSNMSYASAPAEWQGLEQGVDAQAQGETAGELVQFTLEGPVSIPRRSSAAIPILTENANAKRTSIYDASVYEARPLCGATVKNLSGTTWMPGPISVFDGGIYAGDGRIGYVPRGDRRVLSYAVDLELDVRAEVSASSTSHVVAVRPGLLTVERLIDNATIYRIHNKSEHTKNLILRCDKLKKTELVEPDEAWQRTPSRYLFTLRLKPGEEREFRVMQRERAMREESVFDVDAHLLKIWTNAEDLDPALKSRLEEASRIRRALAKIERSESRRSKELKEIIEDQQRMQANLETAGSDTSLGRRYLAKLGEQETRIELLQAEIAESRDRITEKRDELSEVLIPQESAEQREAAPEAEAGS